MLSISKSAAAALAILLLAACSKVTPDNYNKVEAGMDRAAVYDLLGKPDEVSGGGIGGLKMSSETWRGGKHTIEISFVGDKVATRNIETQP